MIYLNLGNTYFLLTNYPEALKQYVDAQKYIKHFADLQVELHFRFHKGYCFWQTREYVNGRFEMNRALDILRSSGKKTDPEKEYLVYKYFAVFDRMEKNNESAIEWYSKILSFCQANKIKIDTARYYQEIASCYYDLSNYTKTIEYLDKADELLKTYPNDRKTYKFRFYLFGLLPFSFWDLGEDTYVIGENKIFTPIDTRNKKLLSISIREAMSENNNDYLKAIEYLNAKKSVVKGKSTVVDAETFITCENNIGYYYFKLGDLNNAKSYFENAFKTSIDAKVNNIDGAFVSLMNLINLYALKFESKDENFTNIKNEIASLLKKAEKFRKDYEKIIYDPAYDDLKSEAKIAKRAISPAEIAELKQTIKEEVDNIYYRIDGAIGILTFYYAELLKNEIASLEDPKLSAKKHSELAEQYYKAYTKLFDSQAAIIRLEIEDEMNSEFPIRMKVNSAMCLHRLGKYDEAIVLFDQAKKQADEFKFIDLSKKISKLISQLPK
jgi:tetratricopeptide (TPR) repeat protein